MMGRQVNVKRDEKGVKGRGTERDENGGKEEKRKGEGKGKKEKMMAERGRFYSVLKVV